MDDSKTQLLDIEPRKILYFEGPFTNVITSYIHLSNPEDHAVCFKVKTTVPKRYCVRPSSGVLNANEDIKVSVMLQPFTYDVSEKNRHKFMIQSMMHPSGDFSVPLEKLWKEADPAKIMDSKLICLLRMPGELAVEPSHELVFEGPFTSPVVSTISLINPSTVTVGYQLQASSTKLNFSPSSGILDSNAAAKIKATLEPFDVPDRHERVLIKSVVIKSDDSRDIDELITSGPTVESMLKCVFSLRGVVLDSDEPIKPAKSGLSMTSAPDSGVGSKSFSMDTLRSEYEKVSQELEAMRHENKVMKSKSPEQSQLLQSKELNANKKHSAHYTAKSVEAAEEEPLHHITEQSVENISLPGEQSIPDTPMHSEQATMDTSDPIMDTGR